VLVVMLVAALLRFVGLDWDGTLGAHPDERYLVGVAEALHWPDVVNPLAVDRSFPYGHFPVYALALAQGVAQDSDPLLVGRGLAALLDLGTVVLTYRLGQRVFGAGPGLFASAMVALAPLHVQQAHFYTADVGLAFFTTSTLLAAARLADTGRVQDALLAGASAGFALSSKASGAFLLLPLGAACVLDPARSGVRWRHALLCGLALLACFVLSSPFALADLRTFTQALAQQAAIARGALDVPYTRQFHGTMPYVYPVLQQLRWGLGLLPGLAAFGGLAWRVGRAVHRPPGPGEWVLLAWAVPVMAFFGGLYAKYPRYVLPVVPTLAICGAALLSPRDRPGGLLGGRLGLRCHRWSQYALATIVVGCLLSRAGALVGMLARPHPWAVASAYLDAMVPPGDTVVVEAWDQPLAPEGAGKIHVLPLTDEESAEKWERISAVVAEADYLVVASRRGYGALARWPERYPETARYYRLLFEGALGLDPVACFGRVPRVGTLLAYEDDPAAGLTFQLPEACAEKAAVRIDWGRLDESFVVYDHPRAIIFRRVGPPISARDIRALILGESE
jgi:hypothetical protein